MKILFVATLAIGVIACNSSKQLHTTAVVQDSTVKAGKDSFSASSSRVDNSEDFAKLTSMLYGLQDAVDAKGNKVQQPYLKEVHYIEKGSKQSSEEKHDTVHVTDTSMQAITRRLDTLDKKSSTQVLPGWIIPVLAGMCVFMLAIFLHSHLSIRAILKKMA